MADKKVSLEIKGDKITAAKFLHKVNAFFGLIEEVADQVAGKHDAVKWIVSVKPGSIVVDASPEAVDAPPEVIPNTIKAISNGINIIENKAERPQYFSDRALQKAQELVSGYDEGTGNGIVSIWVDEKPTVLSEKSASHLKTILKTHADFGGSGTAFGSVEGKLQMVSERGDLHCHIYDALTDKRVECKFDNEIKDVVMSAFGKRVSVYGMIRYNKTGEPGSIKVEDFRILRSKDELPKAADVLGILKD